MTVATRSPKARSAKARRAHLTVSLVDAAFHRLARQRALQTLLRGGLPPALLKRLLKDSVPRRQAQEMPVESWSSLALGIALEVPEFALTLGEALHDHLGWDREPETLEAWWPFVGDRPLEALWMAALSDNKAVRKEFTHVAQHCLDNYRESPACVPPTWDFVEGVLDVHAEQQRDLRELERRSEEAERRFETEHQRIEELREELKKLRRENGDLRAERARGERRLNELAAQAETAQGRDAAHQRFEELERRARKAEKERDHAFAELERARARPAGERDERPAADEAEASQPAQGDTPSTAEEGAPESDRAPLAADPNPRRRVLRHILRKLMKKGKIGASHTHEDNVYRSLADHDKGLAKEAMDLLYREGVFMPKPTVADPHVSIRPERLAEVREIVAGRVENPRLLRFVEP
jgi:hypothetical protein